jgi:flagellar hook-associated protein 2
MTAINTSSISAALTGSTFDWQSFVDTIVSYDSATITTLQKQQSTNSDKVSALQVLETDLTDLQTASTALSADGLFTGRNAISSSSGSTWSLTTANGATTGSYEFNVTQLATTSKRTGTGNIGQAISATDDVSGQTLAALPTATKPTAGTLTINGAQITVGLTDSLQDVFNKISTATGGAVTGSYDHTTDKISLKSSSEIVLGSATDSSNLFSALQLANNGTGTVVSNNALGTTSTTATLANSRLSQAITAVDGSGNGSFAINGVNISYNINSDSLSDVISRINKSSAGVTASYDSNNDQMVISNNTTGDVGFGLSEASGGFLDAVGLSMSSTGATTTRGLNALFTINGGSTLSSKSNTLDSSVTGITGLTVKATNKDAQTITVSSNTDAMQTAIQDFIDKYNVVQSFIDMETSITSSGTSVTTSTLSDNREVGALASTLRSKAFAAVSGLSGTVSRLADLGIDFNGTSTQLTVKDSTKLTAALQNNPDDVNTFFNTASTGFAASMKTYLGTLISASGTTNGAVASMESGYTKTNKDIDNQIVVIEARLAEEKTSMTTAFEAMQTAQANAKSMMDLLKSTFSSSSSGG